MELGRLIMSHNNTMHPTPSSQIPTPEFHPLRVLVFDLIHRVLKRMRPILTAHINHDIQISRYTMEVSDLPKTLENTRIIHLSDLHIHEQWKPDDQLQSLIKTLIKIHLEWGRHLTVFTGDFFSKTTQLQHVRECVEHTLHVFRRIFWQQARIFACEGNHDVMRPNWAEEKQFLETLGIVYTRGDIQWIQVCPTPDYTVDPEWAKMGFDAAVSALDPAILRIILAHNHDVTLWMNGNIPSAPALVLSGHTHGGHAGFGTWNDSLRRILSVGLLGYRHRLVQGAEKIRSNIYGIVSAGAGESPDVPRFNTPREVGVITLKNR